MTKAAMFSIASQSFLLALVLLCGTLSAQQNAMQLGAEALNAYNLAEGATTDFLNAQEVAAAIARGKKPTVTSSPWDTVAQRYDTAARKLKNSPMPTDFDKAKYAFSPQELADCKLREQNLNKARGYLSELQASATRGQDAVATLDSNLERFRRAEVALRYVIDVHTRLITDPIFGQFFHWDWLTLETDVRDSLSDLTQTTEERKNTIEKRLAVIPTLSNNLQSNINMIRSTPCGPEGTWNGQLSSGWPILLNLSKSGNAYQVGTASLNEIPATVEGFNVSGTTVSFSLTQNGRFGFKGKFSGTYSGRTMTGSFTTFVLGSPISGTWSANKQ
jgi:hypothetical protein